MHVEKLMLFSLGLLSSVFTKTESLAEPRTWWFVRLTSQLAPGNVNFTFWVLGLQTAIITLDPTFTWLLGVWSWVLTYIASTLSTEPSAISPTYWIRILDIPRCSHIYHITDGYLELLISLLLGAEITSICHHESSCSLYAAENLMQSLMYARQILNWAISPTRRLFCWVSGRTGCQHIVWIIKKK